MAFTMLGRLNLSDFVCLKQKARSSLQRTQLEVILAFFLLILPIVRLDFHVVLWTQIALTQLRNIVFWIIYRDLVLHVLLGNLTKMAFVNVLLVFLPITLGVFLRVNYQVMV
jgi:hypothetical protein